jgi:hypothetical protein
MMMAITAPEAFALADTYEALRLIARRTGLKAGMPSRPDCSLSALPLRAGRKRRREMSPIVCLLNGLLAKEHSCVR